MATPDRLSLVKPAGFAIVAALVLAACGAADDAPAAQPTTTATTTTTTTTTTEAETSSTAETTTTTEAATTTTTSPFLVDRLAAANGAAETSQQATVTGQLPVRTFDPVTLDEPGTIAGVVWRGIYSFCQDRDGVPDPHASGFLVEFYADAGDGTPDRTEPVFSERFTPDATAETFDDTVDQACVDRPESTWAFYDYEVALTEPFVIDEPGTIWLMIQAVTPGFDTYWGWESAGGQIASLQEFNGELYPVTTGSRAVALIRG